MANDEPKPVTRGKPAAKGGLPGLPGSANPAKRVVKGKAPDPVPFEAGTLPPAITDSIIPAIATPALEPAMSETASPEPESIMAEAAATAPEPATPEAATPEPVAISEPAAPEPVITNPQPTAPVVSAANLQKDKTMEATMQEATNKTQAVLGDVNDRAKSAMEKGAKMFEDMNEFSKGNVEALVESSRIAAKGLESLGQEAAEYTRKQFESTTAIMKSLASAKSPTELFKLQSDYIRQSFDSMVAESSKNTEAMLKLVGEIAQPLSNRVALAAEKAKIAA